MVTAPVTILADTARVRPADVLAYALALPRLAPLRVPDLPYTALARLSALAPGALPPLHSFIASDGARLAYRSYGPRAGLQLLLIHGSACFADQLHHLASHIASQGLAAVHTIDMRGHGQNPRDQHAPANRFAADVAEFALALKRQTPLNRIVIGGHSAGGGLVTQVARLPMARHIAGWLLLAPYLGVATGTVRPFFGGWLTGIDRAGLARALLASLAGRPTGQRPLARFNREAVLHDPRFVRTWGFETVFGFGPGSVAGTGQPYVPASAPVLLLAGDADNCFLPAAYPAALARIAPHGEAVILPGLGHWDILAQPEALAATAGWLQRHWSKGHAFKKEEVANAN